LEHQTNKDYLMPFRMLEYTVAIWRHYIDENKSIAKRKSFKLPPVVPIVYYEGGGKWTVERDIMEKVRKLSGYEKYIPRLEYMVIEASGLEKEWLLDGDTALSKLIYASIVDKEEFERRI
ncbi:MAG: Rpn family recombination-promoting nuclease/putative transposase, partial [Thermotogae bacterium]|nr:Rpn family recombination-promoting nuclease/putative transposase [Thermotogota bacterium]